MRRLLRLLLVLIFILALAAYAVVFNNRASWSILSLLILFLVVNLLTLLPWLRWLKLSGAGTVYTETGSVAKLPLELRADRFFVMPGLSISLPKNSPAEMQLSWYRGEPKSLVLPLESLARGIYQELPGMIKGNDLFGFFQKKRKLAIPVKIVVLPKKVPGMKAVAQKIQQERLRHSYGEPLPLVKNYRAYQQGDPMKRVDWKQSARQQELMIREYEQEHPHPMTLIFWGLESADYEDHLSCFYSLQQVLHGKYRIKFLVLGEGTRSNGNDPEVYGGLQPLVTKPQLGSLQGEHLLIFPTRVEDADFQQQLTELKRRNQVKIFPPEELLAAVGGDSR